MEDVISALASGAAVAMVLCFLALMESAGKPSGQKNCNRVDSDCRDVRGGRLDQSERSGSSDPEKLDFKGGDNGDRKL